MLITIRNSEDLRTFVESGELDDIGGISIVPGYECNFSGIIVSFRKFGKIAFARVLSTFGSIQAMFRLSDLDNYKEVSSLALGSHIKIVGIPSRTKTGEPTILAKSVEILCSIGVPFPDKWNGVSGDVKRSLRYQETLVDSGTHSLIVKRGRFLRVIRKVLEDELFLEVDTPILHHVQCGAQARSFLTNSAVSTGDTYNLRIAPETYLKRMTAGGFHKIFEIGKQFRNEGIDSTHMPEFTSCEWYEAYTDYRDQLDFFKNIFLPELFAGIGEYPFNPNECRVVRFEELYNEYCPVLLGDTLDSDIDLNFKRYVRVNLVEPTFVIDYPAFLAPLAKRNGDTAEMWQFIWNCQEVVKCYSELVDPVLQRQLLEEQALLKDDEAMEIDESFLRAMEFGMPPQAGLGFGVDRLFGLIYGVSDIRDTVFFPFGQ